MCDLTDISQHFNKKLLNKYKTKYKGNKVVLT